MKQTCLPLVALIGACAAPPPRLTPLPGAGLLTETLVAQFGRSADAWNRGDLDAFTSDYVRDPQSGFVSGGHVRRGYQWIPFTLAMERRPDGWKILHDHTSSD